MAAKRIVVLGGGFAGLWSALGAARTLDLAGVGPDTVEVTLLNPDPFHVIRVRCYEADLTPIRVPLDDVLRPVGVRHVEGTATGIDPQQCVFTMHDTDGQHMGLLPYDRLIIATGSALWRPPIPGIGEHAFDVDTYAGATRLQRHLASLGAAGSGRWTAVVIGAGLVGIEIACELRERLRQARRSAGLPDAGEAIRVLLLDNEPEVGAGMGTAALPAIRAALTAAGVEARAGVVVQSVDPTGVVLEGGCRIAAATTICATGMRASPLAGALPVGHDRLGRLPVDSFLHVKGVAGIYVAGDAACAVADAEGHATVMSCQHARLMGRFAGHNAACDLLGQEGERLAFTAPDYVTVLDLGHWGRCTRRAGIGRQLLRPASKPRR